MISEHQIKVLKEVLTFTEVEIAREIYFEVIKHNENLKNQVSEDLYEQEKNIIIFNATIVCEKIHKTKTTASQLLKKLEIAGIIISRSLGMKGTYLKILELEALGRITEVL